MKRLAFVAVALAVVALVFSEEIHRAKAAVTCSLMELSPCLESVISPSLRPPSDACCSRLREQTPCLCGYLEDSTLRQSVDNPNTRRVATTCGVPCPQCSA